MLTKQCHACLQGAMHRTAFTRLREAPPFYLQFLKTVISRKCKRSRLIFPVYMKCFYNTFKIRKRLKNYTFIPIHRYPFFALYSLTHELERALHRQVWLPSGAYLVIDPTEALTVIDVNSGKNIKKKAREELVFSVNVEAAHEIARQLILRNISGICIIDFIDMKEKNTGKS